MEKLLNFSLLVISLIFTSCNDNFLERLPETEIAIDNFFNTEEDLVIYINSLYDFPGFELYFQDNATDNNATTGIREIKTIMTTNANASVINTGWDWSALRDINIFLANSEKAQISEDIRNHYNGIARFFRAQFYMEKVKRYSNVPWYDEVLTPSSEDLFKESDSRSFVIEKIMEDYQFAMDHVFENQLSGNVNKWVVAAYYSRNALYEGTYRKYHSELGLESTANSFLNIAVKITKEIVESNQFSLHTSNSKTAYFELFNQTDLTSNTEVIFSNISVPNIKDSGASETVFGNYEMSPTKDLANSYLMLDGSFFSQQPKYETMTFSEEFVSRDPRMSQTYSFPGWELFNVSSYSNGVRNYVQQFNRNFTGYHQIKGFINSTDQDYTNNIDVPVFRYAEVLLTHAEAMAELGLLNQTLLDATINQLRDRVQMPHLKMDVAKDPILSAKYPKVNSSVLLEIRRERRIEMAFEGRRLDDLNRWHAGKLLEIEPLGLYFPNTGKYDLTGDGVEDVILLDANTAIPNSENREKNSLGVNYIYYRVGIVGENVDFYLTNGNSGNIVATPERGVFQEPKHYYRPIPANEITLNPNLKQLFGWE
jgi:hypothetical protein